MGCKMSRRYFANKFREYDGSDVLGYLKSADFRKATLEKIAELSSLIISQFRPSSDTCDGGLYVGVGGSGYGLWYAAWKNVFPADTQVELLKKGQKLIVDHVKYVSGHRRKLADEVGFLLGDAGLFAAAALAFSNEPTVMEEYISKYGSCAPKILPVDFLSCGGDEMLVGRAGYLSGILNLRRKLGVAVVNDTVLFQICQVVITSGREYARRHRSPCPLMYAYYDTEYLGAAHGLAGILQMLLSFPSFLQAHPDIEHDVHQTVDYMLSLQHKNGNFPCAMDEIAGGRAEADELIHWCHGAPGTIYLLARAYLYWKDAKYLQACVRCGDVIWQKGLLKKGPGICHGVAGNGYAFLLLYQLTDDKQFLYKALKFAEFMDTDEFQKEARRPDSPYSLYEGLAGTLCFYVDLLDPKSAEFPLSPVFL